MPFFASGTEDTASNYMCGTVNAFEASTVFELPAIPTYVGKALSERW